MKTQKLFILLFSFVFILSSNIANAQVNGNNNGLKNKNLNSIETSLALAGPNKQTVNNSLLNLNGSVAKEYSRLLIQVTKNNYSQQHIISINDGLYETSIPLEDGPGIYKIQLFVEINKTITNYKFIKSLTVENTDSRINSSSSNKRTVDDSLLDLNGSVAKEYSWLLIQITKNNSSKQHIIPVNNGLYETSVPLEDGPGSYIIQLFVANTRMSANYVFHRTINVENTDSRENSSSSNKQTVNNSLLDFKGSLAQGNSWILINITKNNYSYKEMIPAINGVYDTRIPLQDGPGIYTIQVFEADAKMGANYVFHKTITVENTDSRDMSFLLPTQKVQSGDDRIKSLALSITKNAQNDEEAFMAIYKYVTQTIKYDYAAVADNSYTQIDYNAINTLLDSKAVCEGYANLVAALSRAYGIRTKVIFGSATNSLGTFAHGWNEVFINNQWKLVDATWDSILKNYSYLFMDAKEFSKEHTKETEMNY